jgi:microcystin-dependent protein
MEPIFLGQISIFGGNFAPRGWAFCDGQLLPISQYTALFSILGTTYGGDGRTTFGLPGLRGRVAMHPGNGPGLSSRRSGEKGGQERVTLSTLEMPEHNHTPTTSVAVSTGVGDEGTPTGVLAAHSGAFTEDGNGAQLGGVSTTVNNTGGGQSHNNIQPFLCVNYIIALQGSYPSRS